MIWLAAQIACLTCGGALAGAAARPSGELGRAPGDGRLHAGGMVLRVRRRRRCRRVGRAAGRGVGGRAPRRRADSHGMKTARQNAPQGEPAT